MNPERFQQIMDLFEAALDLEPDERGAFLDEKCRDDQEMRKEVEALLAADTKSDVLLESLIPENMIEDRITDRLVGTRLGQYEIQRVISSGGMGTVYEALQEKPWRTVAVKVMREGIASKSALRRFEYESQILARLRHPGIAQVYEAGTQDLDGGSGAGKTLRVPYFVMEFISGARSITDYAGEEKRTTGERLALFMQICEAVHHGHQKGIIHRDLKPQNILVDANGHVKIIDFGVARATDSDMALTTLQTEVGQIIGTLQYMSPEQCWADPHDLDTRSDVYSLGVVLYELVCGHLPYDVRKLPVFEAVQRIRDEKPKRPSTILRYVKGDLETILFKALEKDRERRYPSADALRRDLDHFMKGEPILARPPSVVYQIKVFVRRNKVLVGGVLAVFLALAVGFITSLSLYFQAEAARGKAADEAETTRAVNDFFNEMLASIDPMQINIVSGFMLGEGRTPLPPRTSEYAVSVEEMLDHAAGRVAETFEDRPELEAEVRMRIGLTYGSLGLYRKARPQLEAALGIRIERLGEDHLDTLCSRIQLAFIDLRFGKPAAAESLSEARAAYEGMRRLFGDEHPHTLTSAAVQAALMSRAGLASEADPLFRKTLKAQVRIFGEADRITLWTRCQWAYLLLLRLQLPEAHEQIQAVLEIIGPSGSSPYDENDYITVFSKGLLGGYCMFSNEYPRAEELLRDAIDRSRNILGEGHWFRCGFMWCLGNALTGESKLDERERLFREALEGFISRLGYKATWTFRTGEELGKLLAYRGRYDEVVATYQAMWDACLPGDEGYDFHVPGWFELLVNALMNRGRFDEGAERCREWVRTLSKILGDENPRTLKVLADTGSMLFYSRKVEEAREFVGKAINGWQRLASSGKASVSDLNAYAMLLLTCKPEDLRDPEEALVLAMKANELSEGKDPLVLDTLAQAYRLTGDPDKALKFHQSAVKAVKPNALNVLVTVELNLIRFLLQSGDNASAARLIEEMEALVDKFQRQKTHVQRILYSALAPLLAEEGQYALAEPMARACLALWSTMPLGSIGSRPDSMKSVLGRCLAGMGLHEEAEILLKEGFEKVKNNPMTPLEDQQRALEWLIRFYEERDRSAEASKWRENRPAIGLPESGKR